MVDRAGLWPLRVMWLALPAAVGPAFADALTDRARAVSVVAATLAWAGWAAGLLSVLIPRSVGLTVVRVLTPVAVGLAGWIAFDPDVVTARRAVALVATLLAALAAFLPSSGERLVDGSSYGDEHRVLLRLPTPLLAGPVQLAWLLVVAPPVAAPLLAASGRWVAAAAVAGAGAAPTWWALVRLHQLSRRWLVFVPAGVVVHDPLSLGDPVLFPRRLIRRIGPAPRENPALDLTRGATGLALEVDTVEPVVVAPVRPGEELVPVGVTSILVTPTRPGHVLQLARSRRLPVS